MVATVFIIGAGASFEVGLPIGDTLKQQIARAVDIRYSTDRRMSGDNVIDACVRHLAQKSGTRDINPYLHAGWHIREAMPLSISIDNFLENHKSDPYIKAMSKLGIAKLLLESEKKSKIIFTQDRNRSGPPKFESVGDCWHIRFAQLLFERCAFSDLAERLSTFSIISFNYDRCIKHFLLHAIVTYYRVSAAEAAKALHCLRIVHPYGSLGPLEWEDRSQGVPYGGREREGDLITIAVERIRTFSEGVADPDSHSLISSSISSADKIIFLGFAFLPINLEILRARGKKKIKEVFGTAKGISKSDLSVVERQLHAILAAAPRSDFYLEDMTCYNFFGEYWRSLAFAPVASSTIPPEASADQV